MKFFFKSALSGVLATILYSGFNLLLGNKPSPLSVAIPFLIAFFLYQFLKRLETILNEQQGGETK